MGYCEFFTGSKENVERVLKVERILYDLTSLDAIREIESFLYNARCIIGSNNEQLNAIHKSARDREFEVNCMRRLGKKVEI